MCFFKKKQDEFVGSLYKKGEFVNFVHHGENCPGFIENAHRAPNGEFSYDIQIGGECPAIVKNVPSKLVRKMK